MKLVKRESITHPSGKRMIVLTVRRRLKWWHPFRTTERYAVVYGMQDYPNWFRLDPFEEVTDSRNSVLFEIVKRTTRADIEREALEKERRKQDARLREARNMFSNAGAYRLEEAEHFATEKDFSRL